MLRSLECSYFPLENPLKFEQGEFSRYRFCAIIGMSGLVSHAVLQFLSEQKKLIILFDL